MSTPIVPFGSEVRKAVAYGREWPNIMAGSVRVSGTVSKKVDIVLETPMTPTQYEYFTTEQAKSARAGAAALLAIREANGLPHDGNIKHFVRFAFAPRIWALVLHRWDLHPVTKLKARHEILTDANPTADWEAAIRFLLDVPIDPSDVARVTSMSVQELLRYLLDVKPDFSAQDETIVRAHLCIEDEE